MVKINELKKYWDNNIDKFLSIVESVEYQPKGIWYTEAFLFCSICDLLKVDAIIESGVAYGVGLLGQLDVHVQYSKIYSSFLLVCLLTDIKSHV